MPVLRPCQPRTIPRLHGDTWRQAMEPAIKPRAKRARRERSHAQAAGRAWRVGFNGGGPAAKRSPNRSRVCPWFGWKRLADSLPRAENPTHCADRAGDAGPPPCIPSASPGHDEEGRGPRPHQPRSPCSAQWPARGSAPPAAVARGEGLTRPRTPARASSWSDGIVRPIMGEREGRFSRRASSRREPRGACIGRFGSCSVRHRAAFFRSNQ